MVKYRRFRRKKNSKPRFLDARLLVLTEDNSVHNSLCGNLTSCRELLKNFWGRPETNALQFVFLISGT